MAGAPEGNQNAAGPHVVLNNRAKVAKLRGLVVDECIKILEKPRVDLTENEKELRDDVLLKLAGTVMPRLQELTGPDGEKLNIFFDPAFKSKLNEPPSETATNSKESEAV